MSEFYIPEKLSTIPAGRTNLELNKFIHERLFHFKEANGGIMSLAYAKHNHNAEMQWALVAGTSEPRFPKMKEE